MQNRPELQNARTTRRHSSDGQEDKTKTQIDRNDRVKGFSRARLGLASAQRSIGKNEVAL